MSRDFDLTIKIDKKQQRGCRQLAFFSSTSFSSARSFPSSVTMSASYCEALSSATWALSSADLIETSKKQSIYPEGIYLRLHKSETGNMWQRC